MRVDFVITELRVGGAERCLTEVACGLKARGHDVRVFALAPLPVMPQSQLVEKLRSCGVDVASGESARPYQMMGCLRRLRAWLRADRADVCQTFLFHANVIGTFAARSIGVPIRVGGIRVAEPKPWRCRLEKLAVRRMDHVVSVSEAVAAFAERELGVPSANSSVIGNGVDARRIANAAAYHWEALGWSPDSLVTLFVGRLHPQKGLELVQQRIDEIAPAGTNRRLLLIGDGVLRPSLEHWAKTIGRDRVQLVGWQPDVASYLKASRVLVLPSHYEGMANVVLEAFAAGIPVVCSRVEGSAELVRYEPALQSFEAGDSAGMAERLRRFAEDVELCRRIGQANSELAQRMFSIDTMVDAYEKLYRDLCARLLELR